MARQEDDDPAAMAREALRLSTVDPTRARPLAENAARAAEAASDHATRSIAARACATAAYQLGELPEATDSFREAIKAARRADAPVLVAEARAGLAGTYCVRGWPLRALKEIQAALDGIDGVDAARVRTRRAAILQVLGRPDDALADLRLAIPVLHGAGDADWATRALSNRGLLYISRRAFAAAETDLLAAQQLCVEHGLTIWAAYVEQNLAWLNANRGEMVAALHHLDAAERRYHLLGTEVGSLLTDRGRLLLSLRLIEEARTAADAAVLVHRSHHEGLEAPAAQLLLSTVALVQGDLLTAEQAAKRASRGYRRLNHHGGTTLARYAALQASWTSRPESVSAGRVRALADDLEDAGWTVPALEARVLAGHVALARGRIEEARNDLRRASRLRVAGTAEVRVRGWLAEALLRRADGRNRAATAAIHAGLHILEDHQATLGATELRAHVTMHRDALSGLGLEIAVEAAEPRRVLTFVEHGRASALRFRSPRPPDDPALSQSLSDLRMTIKEIEQRRDRGQPTAGLLQHQIQLERTIADHTRRQPAKLGSPRRLSRRGAELAAALKDVVLIEYIELDERLLAVTMLDGRARLRHLGSIQAVRECLPKLGFLLRRLASPQSSARSKLAATDALRHIQSTLEKHLMAPLAADLKDRSAIVVPSRSLQTLPWSVVPSFSGRPVSVVPSATLWLDANSRSAPAADRVVVVAGPGLPGARDEATAVADIHPTARRLLDGNATASVVSAALDGATLVHVAAHGRLRSDNPFFSSLILHDGPLTVYDLERLAHAPRHVVLAACEIARSQSVAVEEVLGLAAALLAAGTVSLVAPVLSVVDAAVVSLMVDYHTELRTGRAPAAALAAAQEKAAASGPAGWAAAAAFICMGAGGTSVQPVSAPVANCS